MLTGFAIISRDGLRNLWQVKCSSLVIASRRCAGSSPLGWETARHFSLAHPLLEQPRHFHPPLFQSTKVPPHTRTSFNKIIADELYRGLP